MAAADGAGVADTDACMSVWRLMRSLSTDERNTFLACFGGWALDAFDFFLVVVAASKIAEDLGGSGRDPSYSALSGVLTTVQRALGIAAPAAQHPTGDATPIILLTLTLTLVMRPVGALCFGIFAERSGRRRPLLINIAFFSAVELLTAFSPNIIVFLVMRVLFGIGMGGEWGVGAALAMESLPRESRGLLSAILQQGYPFGYLVAASLNFVVSSRIASPSSWRLMFALSVVPALVFLLLRRRVKESPEWERSRQAAPDSIAPDSIAPHVPSALSAPNTSGAARANDHANAAGVAARPDQGAGMSTLTTPFIPPTAHEAARATRRTADAARRVVERRLVRRDWRLFGYFVALMTTFTFMAHGTQDIYPTFLQQQVGLLPAEASLIAFIFNIGGICGGILFGYHAQCRRLGRRRPIIVAAAFGLLLVPLWTGLFPWGPGQLPAAPGLLSPEVLLLTIGAFLMQFMVQGAYGVIPAHLTELSPSDERGAFPGVVYHLGNLVGGTAPLLIVLLAGSARGVPNYAGAQAVVMVVVFLALIAVTALGPEQPNIPLRVTWAPDLREAVGAP
jgi:SHS family lactate transporter-like MFS transporter